MLPKSIFCQIWFLNVSFTYSDFEDLSESMLLSIVKEEALNIRELELFDAVKRWAGRQCTQKELEINGTNMREV